MWTHGDPNIWTLKAHLQAYDVTALHWTTQFKTKWFSFKKRCNNTHSTQIMHYWSNKRHQYKSNHIQCDFHTAFKTHILASCEKSESIICLEFIAHMVLSVATNSHGPVCNHLTENTDLTSAEEFHDQPQFIFHNKWSVVGHHVWMVALTHGLNLFLWTHMTFIKLLKCIFKYNSCIGLQSFKWHLHNTYTFHAPFNSKQFTVRSQYTFILHVFPGKTLSTNPFIASEL